MSRRESCVWHPMPEEVRRSSVQSRRASLAAGRRKSMNTNEPDWEVEAPPTPPRGDYTPRDEHSAAAVVADEPAAAAAAPAAVVAAAAAAPAEQEPSKEREVSPAQEPEGTEVVEHEAPAAAEANEEAAAAAVAADEEEAREAVASVKSERLSEASAEKAEEAHAEAVAAPEAVGRGRTRHIVRFHGEKWAKVLSKQRADVEAAFLADIKECAGVEAEEAKRLKVKMTDCMEVTFVVFSEDRARQKNIHSSLQQYKFPHTCHVYVAYKA